MKDISDSCQFDMSELKYHYPQEFLPAGKTAFQYLTELTWQKAHERYDNIPDKVQTLIMHELELIQNLNFADYFLTVWDIVRWAREQKILCQGRGSAANSAICYVLGVTNVDPSEFDVLFERFISIERGDPPDIDVDFEHERREEVIQYVYQRYGRNKAAMVANVICFKKKGAVRAVGKALGVPEIILDEAAKYLSMRQYRRSATQKTISEASDKIFLSENLQNIWREYSEKLLGFPRHLGIHSGGFLLSNDPIDELVPREPATMPGRTCLQWCKDDIEGLGFFKIDLLALGMLTAIRKIFHTLKIHYGQDLAMQTVPPNDSKTYNMIQKADTVGVFQIESRAQMQMLPRLRPEKFYDLVIEIAIIRPGPIQGKMIHPYLKRRRGLEPEEYPHEKLIPILKRTLGIPIFQEQVMRIAMAVGDFTAGESNELRKNIGTFSMRGDVEKWIPKLITGMRRNGIKEDFIKHLIGQLHGFSAYGFPESHSVSFAHLAYISCYLKAHFPPAFYIGIMNSQPMGFYSIHVLLRTAKLEGINIRPICVLHSQWDSTIEKDPDSTHGFAIRLGLRLVTSLSASGAKAYLARRQHYSSLHDFLTQCQLSRVDLTALAAANALQIFNIKRRTALWLSEAAPYSSFFLNANEPVPFFSELSAAENVQLDFISQKTTLGEHPTEIIKKEAWAYKIDVAKITLAKNLKVSPPSLVHVFGMVLVRQSPPTAKGMVFITMEDETGMINLVFDPKTYDKYQKLIDFKGIIFAQGVLQNESGSISIFVKQVHSPEEKLAEVFKLEILEQEEFSAIRNYM